MWLSDFDWAFELIKDAVNEVTDPKLGMPNLTSQCPTCGAKDVKSCEGHFGVIKFRLTIIHPYFISEFAQILNKICPGCKSVRRNRVKVSFREFYPRMKFNVSSNDLFGKTAIIVEVQKSNKSQNKISGDGLATDYWDVIPIDAQQQGFTKPNKRILSHAQDGRTRAFRKLVDFRGNANELSSRVLDGLKTSKIRAEQSPTNDSSSSTSGLKYVKELLLGKRSDHAFRMVVIGDPNLKLSEIGIPCYIAERLQVSEHLNKLNWDRLNTCCNLRILEKGEIYVRRKDQLIRVNCMGKLQIGDIVYRPLNDGDIVLINRPPSIHQHSFIALSVKVLPIKSVFSINPLICSPFRGDFDGDCLHGYVPQSIDARVELQELVALDRQLVNGQSGRNLLSLSHDSLTAAHLVVEDGVLLNLCGRGSNYSACSCLRILIMFVHQMAFIFVRVSFYLRLTGLLGYVTPDENLYECLIEHCREKALYFLYSAQHVLCEWLSMRGLSVSLSDLYLSSDLYSRKNMTDEVSWGLQEAERISHIKLLMVDGNRDFLIGSEESLNAMNFGAERMCYEKQKSAALSQGLQYASLPLSFRMPHQLSCSAWNDHKAIVSGHVTRDIPDERGGPYVPCAVVESSFLTGLNPLECFVHSLTSRDSSFSDNADLPGTLNRRLMFFMRDLYAGYDGTVRNAYGNQIVQFSYNIKDTASPSSGTDGSFYDSACGAVGGQPVGSLAACAISEAAYSALDHPISALETSPLLNLKKILECGVKKISGDKTASLYLSKKLGRWTHGFEYGALEVQSHLERLLFSDIVSTVMILDCSDMQKENNATFCITVTMVERTRNLDVQFITFRDMVIPSLLGTVVKDCLSTTGEFVALNAKGFAVQRKNAFVSSPFVQACFSNPADCLIKAAKKGLQDDLQGCLDELSWGKTPSIGTGGRFDIMYSGKGHELTKPENIYELLGGHVSSQEQNLKVKVPGEYNGMSDKCDPWPLCTSDVFSTKGNKNLEVSKKILRSFISLKDIQRLRQALKNILHKYPINHSLNEVDKSIATMALYFHPRGKEKIGNGALEIKVGHHPEHEDSRCFLLVRTDGTVEDFSYHKCVHGALEIIAPQRAKTYQSTWSKGTMYSLNKYLAYRIIVSWLNRPIAKRGLCYLQGS
ncbi:hypothetical protein HYC85_007335 [Camellia sinensis]|uniref:DNA-directed RNA polymerase n=1 Tax=Camellia sinensis TaxID=4442 RepID=A0A7J7HP22_CAMSI|nr:hypothetical protein HYC85_007335 [Camellia sinensis]